MKWVIGIDEVGRGPFAGPVTVCAVAMPQGAYKRVLASNTWNGLTDSKKLKEKDRELWAEAARALAKEASALRIATASRTATAIDKKGIAVCIRECIAANLKKLQLDPKDCVVLLDGGLKAPAEYKNQTTIIKGDLHEKIISLASVVAKVQRDHYMIALHKKHPAYNWQQNKGYGTLGHRTVIKKRGLTPFHRKSFIKALPQ